MSERCVNEWECTPPGGDPVDCMLAALRPGFHDDAGWIDHGAPKQCHCPCHDGVEPTPVRYPEDPDVW